MKNILKKRIIGYAGAVFLWLGVTACNESVLDITNPGALSPANYPGSVADLEQLLVGVYGTQHAPGLFGHNMLGKNTYLWDHTTDLSWQGTPTWIQLAQNNSQPNDGFLADTWRDLWKGVQRSNVLLSNIVLYREKAGGDEAAALNLIEGQGRFLRAWYYFYLINTWGESYVIGGQGGDKKGVPLLTESASSLPQTQVPRATVREVWDLIIADLKTSEQLLKGTVWSSSTNKYKVTEWAAKGLLGKSYVFMQDWNNAKTYLKDVVDNSGKELVPFDIYEGMFNGKNEFNSESLFEINMNVDMTVRGNSEQSMGSSIGMVIAPTYVGDNGGQAASAWSNVFPHARNIKRFGFNEGHYFKAGTTTVSPANVDPGYVTRSLKARADKTVDPRLWVACLQPYVDSMTVAGKRRAISHYLDINELDMEAWSFRKYVNLQGTESEINMANGSNFLWLRLADVYLLYAETLMNTGNNELALEYINKVKRRAYALPVNAPSKVDYPSLTAPTKASDPVLGNDPLKYERWAELFGEGHWWFDVCRWRLGEKEAAFYERIRGGAIEWKSTAYAQPIPINELNANVEMIQNPGY